MTEEFHLNVPDRKNLDGGKIAGSDLVRTIVAIVEESGRYPRNWQPSEPFDGGLIEKTGAGTYHVTWKAEVGVSQYKVMSVQEFSYAQDAAKLVAEKFFGASYDGIPIDWSK